jgi:hypothetical protein
MAADRKLFSFGTAWQSLALDLPEAIIRVLTEIFIQIDLRDGLGLQGPQMAVAY